jgi:tRNA(fMet)-specific endonuclease VapC
MSPAILDTDTLSELIKLRNPTVTQHALAYTQQQGQLVFSAMTRYEILRGYKKQNATTQLARFAIVCQNSLLLPVTNSIFDRASDLWAFAYWNGHPKHDADLLIAAIALEHQRLLVTGNHRHFAWIPGLTIADWRLP